MNENTEYGIKYKRFKFGDNAYVLIPDSIIEGYSVGEDFFSDQKTLKILSLEGTKLLENNKALIWQVISLNNLSVYYNYEAKSETDAKFLANMYFLENKDFLTFAFIKDGKVSIKKVDIDILKCKSILEIYEKVAEDAAVVLSDAKLSEMMDSSSLDDMKKELESLKGKMHQFEKLRHSGVSKIMLEDGRICQIETEGKVYVDKNDSNFVNINFDEEEAAEEEIDYPYEEEDYNIQDISVQGLEKYLKERVIGHDEELRALATVLIHNTLVKNGNRTRNILIAGPTGTGKTLSLEAAAEYMGLPFVNINTININPEGYYGTSLEDEFLNLIDKCGGNMSMAQRAIVAFDEFDKIGESSLELKEAMKSLFLKIAEGARIPLQERVMGTTERYDFDTSLLNKVYLGAFAKAFEKDKTPIGFVSANNSNITFSRERLINCGYYENELLSRIPIMLPYYPLTKDQMEQTLFCKSSELVKEMAMLKETFGVDILGAEDFAKGAIELITSSNTSMRDLNNIIANAFIDIEYELLANKGKCRKLVLTRDTAKDHKKFDLS